MAKVSKQLIQWIAGADLRVPVPAVGQSTAPADWSRFDAAGIVAFQRQGGSRE
jgi:hypothetical protein